MKHIRLSLFHRSMFFKKLFILGTVSMGGLFWTPQAHAQMAVHDPVTAANVIAEKMENINLASLERELETNLSSAEQNLQKQISSYASQLTDMDFNKLAAQGVANQNAQMSAEANMNLQKENLATTRAVQSKVYDAARSATTGASICNNITGAIKTANFEKAKEIYLAQLAQQTMAAGNGFIGNTFVGGTLMDKNLNSYHCAHNASLEDVKNGRCPSVTETGTNDTQTPSSDAPSVSADVNANIVMGHSDLSEKDQQNFNNMMRTLHNQAMGMPPNIGSMSPGTPEGRALIKEQQEKEALTSIGMAAMEDVGSEKAVIKLGDNDTMQSDGLKWAQETAKNVVGYTPDSNGKYFPNGVSNQDITELRSKSWYYNPQTNLRQGAQDESASIKDIGSMLAWQQVMNFKMLKALQSIQYTLGALEQMEAGHEGALTGSHK